MTTENRLCPCGCNRKFTVKVESKRIYADRIACLAKVLVKKRLGK